MIDPRTAEWRELRALIIKQIEEAQKALEAKGMPMQETSEFRGEIYGLRKLLQKVEEPILPEENQPVDYSRN